MTSTVGKRCGETSTLANILGGYESSCSLSREQISDYSSKLSMQLLSGPVVPRWRIVPGETQGCSVVWDAKE